MNAFLSGLSLFLLVNVIVGLVRVWLGPTAPDRMLAPQLLGTTGTAILLLLAEYSSTPSLRDVALVLALLGAITTIVFVRRWLPATRERKARCP